MKLLIFFLGFFFGAWGTSLLDNLFNIFIAWLQQIAAKIVKGTTDGNSVSAIGFTIPEEGDCEDD